MAKSNKLSQLELTERRKRIPQRTQEVLRKMISRRHAELCGSPEGGNRQGKRKPKPYLPEPWPGLASEPDAELQLELAKAEY